MISSLLWSALRLCSFRNESADQVQSQLNKYCVVPGHFLLVTQTFKVQGSPLTPEELTAGYKLLAAAKRQNRPYFMFFNHGIASGSSQRHKHLQFIPTSGSSPDQSPDGPPVEKLARRAKLEADCQSIGHLPKCSGQLTSSKGNHLPSPLSSMHTTW